MPQRQQHQQSHGDLNRPKGAIRPSGFWIPAKLVAAREHYDAVQEGHSYVYSQSPYRAHPGRRVVILEPSYTAISETRQIGLSELHLLHANLTTHVGPCSAADVLDRVPAIAHGIFKENQIAQVRHAPRWSQSGVAWPSKSTRRRVELAGDWRETKRD